MKMARKNDFTLFFSSLLNVLQNRDGPKMTMKTKPSHNFCCWQTCTYKSMLKVLNSRMISNILAQFAKVIIIIFPCILIVESDKNYRQMNPNGGFLASKPTWLKTTLKSYFPGDQLFSLSLGDIM